MFLWEETGKCTRGTHRGKGPGTWGKTCGDSVGKGHLPAGTGDNLLRHKFRNGGVLKSKSVEYVIYTADRHEKSGAEAPLVL